jgi:drug/metabolite transporter (DMT)-like permease
MLPIAAWTLVYGVVVAASIIFIGSPSKTLGSLNLNTLFSLLLDWRFLFGCTLALGARFIFVIINNLASKHSELSNAHLSIAALATTLSIVFVLFANYIFLNEHLGITQIIGAAVIVLGIFLVFH